MAEAPNMADVAGQQVPAEAPAQDPVPGIVLTYAVTHPPCLRLSRAVSELRCCRGHRMGDQTAHSVGI